MTTDYFLPTIGQNQQKEQQQKRRGNGKQVKQTIEEGDADSFQVSSSSSNSFPGKETTKIADSATQQSRDSSNLEEKPLVVEGGEIQNAIEEAEEQTKTCTSDTFGKAQFIDSRSILSNKEKLKRFWEHRMEMEFKLRQQREQQSTLKGSKQQQQQQISQQKPVGFDENNNSGSNNKHNGNNGATGDIDAQQVQCASDEEWRSLSPNVEPTTLNGPFNRSPANKLAQQVSVELVCEKLRDYQTNNNDEVQLGYKKTLTNGHSKSAASESSAQVRSRDQSELNESETSKQVPNNRSNNATLINDCGHDETQLMSIDPTLCHSSGVGELVEVNNNDDTEYGEFLDIKPIDPASGSSSSLTEDLFKTYNKHQNREEQTVNEEFSSSSNSSFGPMSISVTREEDSSENNKSNDSANKISLDKATNKTANTRQGNYSISDEDDLSSAQSGSVLTVINKFDAIEQPNQELTFSDLESKPSPLRNYVTSTQSDSQLTDSSMAPESMLADNNRLKEDNNLNSEGYGDEDEESGSNIGVAFESLQFDSEIKSSKQEKVDDELLIAPTPVKRPVQSKFNANEVKSVCNFITNAITDATRQVESYVKGQTGAVMSKESQQQRQSSKQSVTKDTDQMVGSIQHARFIPHQSDTPEEETDSKLNGALSCNLNRKNDEDEAEDGDDYANYVQQAVEDEEQTPSTDLSSIFEANVRREIERFETNSMIKKSLSGKLADVNGLTKWRIAEEIRQFNEREQELKRRLEVNVKKEPDCLGNGNGNASIGSESSAGSNNNQEANGISRQHQETALTVVRFGKALQIPKPASPATNQDLIQTNNNLLPCKSIRLSTSVNSSNSSTISMHKFIASGGKRFVFTGGSNGTGATTLQSQNQLTKSMSNLSSIATRGEPQKVADYKAVDSLLCKESPNVKPGLTRKVIETFSQLSHRSRLESQQSSGGPTSNGGKRQQSVSVNSSQPVQNGYQHQGSGNSAPSAEWKIQEELREMRAREAELRNQRNHRHLAQKNTDQGSANSLLGSQQVNDDRVGGESIANGDTNRLESDGGEQTARVDNLDSSSTNNYIVPSSNGHCGFSNESLYPIKQTIDSFRKLNSSSKLIQSAPAAALVQQPQHVNSSPPTPGDQRRQSQQATNDYDSKVGGQRRKISMIEKWENRLH